MKVYRLPRSPCQIALTYVTMQKNMQGSFLYFECYMWNIIRFHFLNKCLQYIISNCIDIPYFVELMWCRQDTMVRKECWLSFSELVSYLNCCTWYWYRYLISNGLISRDLFISWTDESGLKNLKWEYFSSGWDNLSFLFVCEKVSKKMRPATGQCTKFMYHVLLEHFREHWCDQ